MQPKKISDKMEYPRYAYTKWKQFEDLGARTKVQES